MKLVKIFCLVLLLAMSAAAVKAGSMGNNDPKVVINCGKPPCGGTVLSNFESLKKNGDPMFTVELEYTGPTITSLIVGLSPATAFWTGSSDIFTSPVAIRPSPPEALFSGGTLVSGDFINVILTATIPGPFVINFPKTFSCVDGCNSGGTNGLTVGTTFVATPEPSTMLMFLSLGPAIGFARKRWNARNAS